MVRRRHFWCELSGREVEVEFEEDGFPGFRLASVVSCSAFEPATAVACDRRCGDPVLHRQWQRVPGLYTRGVFGRA